MSQAQAIGLLLAEFAIGLSVARSIRAGCFGPIERADDPVAFWGIIGFFVAIMAIGAVVAAVELAP